MRRNIKYLIVCLTVLFSSCGSIGEGFLAAMGGIGGIGGIGGMGGMGGYGGYGGWYTGYDPSYQSAAAGINYLADPSYAASNVFADEERQYQLFCQNWKKPDGSNYTKDEWRSMIGGGTQNSQTATTNNITTSNNTSSTTNSSSSRRCLKLSALDTAHCNRTGVCGKCNGAKKYFDSSFGVSHWVDPCVTCGGSGKCRSCNGSGWK